MCVASHHGYEHPVCTPVQYRVKWGVKYTPHEVQVVDVLVYYCIKVEII